MTTCKTTRRAVLACAASAAVVPLFGAKAAQSDPIYAALDNYKRANAFHLECCNRTAKLENDLSAEYAAADALIDALPDTEPSFVKLCEDLQKTDPRWTMANTREMFKHVARREAATDEMKALQAEIRRFEDEGPDREYLAYKALLTTVPHTIAGAMTLLSFMIEEGRKGSAKGGSLASMDFEADEDEGGASPHFVLLTSLYDCLEGVA